MKGEGKNASLLAEEKIKCEQIQKRRKVQGIILEYWVRSEYTIYKDGSKK